MKIKHILNVIYFSNCSFEERGHGKCTCLSNIRDTTCRKHAHKETLAIKLLRRCTLSTIIAFTFSQILKICTFSLKQSIWGRHCGAARHEHACSNPKLLTSSLLIHLRGRRWWLKCLSSCHPHRQPRWSPRLMLWPYTAGSVVAIWKVNWQNEDPPLRPSAFQINKRANL